MTKARTASLGMYDLPALHDANDALWHGLAGWLQAHGVDGVPWRLDRDRPLDEIWDDPDLLLAQTCGFPLATRWRDRLRYVATPTYAASGCEGPAYRSVLLVPSDSSAEQLIDLRGTTVAINEPSSNSGCNLLAAELMPMANEAPFFGSAVLTGSHLASARAVAEGRVSIAAIDVVTYAHLSRTDPALTGRLRKIGWTALAPGLPLVTSIRSSPQLVSALREALAWASVAPELAGARQTLLLSGFTQVPQAAYADLASLSDADGCTVPNSLIGGVKSNKPWRRLLDDERLYLK